MYAIKEKELGDYICLTIADYPNKYQDRFAIINLEASSCEIDCATKFERKSDAVKVLRVLNATQNFQGNIEDYTIVKIK